MSEIAELVFEAQALVHQIVDDAHMMFQIAASSDVSKDLLQKRHSVYAEHMRALEKSIKSINDELELNPISVDSYPDPGEITKLKEERDKLAQSAKQKNDVLKALIDKLRHLQLSVQTLKFLGDSPPSVV